MTVLDAWSLCYSTFRNPACCVNALYAIPFAPDENKKLLLYLRIVTSTHGLFAPRLSLYFKKSFPAFHFCPSQFCFCQPCLLLRISSKPLARFMVSRIRPHSLTCDSVSSFHLPLQFLLLEDLSPPLDEQLTPRMPSLVQITGNDIDDLSAATITCPPKVLKSRLQSDSYPVVSIP